MSIAAVAAVQDYSQQQGIPFWVLKTIAKSVNEESGLVSLESLAERVRLPITQIAVELEVLRNDGELIWPYGSNQIGQRIFCIPLGPLGVPRPPRYAWPIDPGFVYLMQANQRYKIGHSAQPRKRREEVQTRIKEPVRLRHTIHVPQMLQAERALHAHFAHAALGEECFQLTDDEVAWFCDQTTTEVRAWL